MCKNYFRPLPKKIKIVISYRVFFFKVNQFEITKFYRLFLWKNITILSIYFYNKHSFIISTNCKSILFALIPQAVPPRNYFLYAKGESDFSHAPRAHKLKLKLTLFFAVPLWLSVTTRGTYRWIAHLQCSFTLPKENRIFHMLHGRTSSNSCSRGAQALTLFFAVPLWRSVTTRGAYH